jgi:hypothetical protein
MAEQPAVPENVTPEQFFEQLMPAGFAAQREAGVATAQDFTLHYHLAGAGGGDWLVTIKEGRMTGQKGSGEANLTFTLSVDDWRDTVLGRDGASLAVIIPQPRPGRPDNSARAKQMRGTLALELGREGNEPMKVEMMFNDAAHADPDEAPRLRRDAGRPDERSGGLHDREAQGRGRHGLPHADRGAERLRDGRVVHRGRGV